MESEEHTSSPLSDLLRQDPKDPENLNHDLANHVGHSRRRSDLYVCFETLKKEFDAVKDLYKNILTSADSFDSLRDRDVTKIYMLDRRIHSLEGVYQSQQKSHLTVGISVTTRMRDGYRLYDILQLTSPIPLPRAAENAHKTLTVGSSHFVNPSFPLRD